MNLKMPSCVGVAYSSPTQQARVITESWMSDQGYCPACLSCLAPKATNFKAVDFSCPKCSVQYQLKSTRSKIGTCIPDGAYETMLAAVRSDACPALVLMRYNHKQWTVLDLIVIPSFAFVEQAIIPRRPLASAARRAGWIGCNIDLSKIAPQARANVVNQSVVRPRVEVANCYARLKPLQFINFKQRGWAMAILNGIQIAGWAKFTTRDAYQLENSMLRMFPSNRNIRPKIRQQLQVLRDLGIIKHTRRGHWIVNHAEENTHDNQEEL